ncbi:MAG: hypothetical protein SWE60_20325 [Thermodesulfobacteriota bacterium]|nr:hypothetical protein [Thermodesulfobacteriota bacterium]
MPTAVGHKEETLSLGFKEERKNTPDRAFCLTSLICMISLGLCSSFVSVSAYAALCTGPINDLGESSGIYWWGDGEINLHMEWSVHNAEGGDAWLYGSSYSWSNVDVYVYEGLSEHSVITDATAFHYTNAVVLAGEGDTVFFRSANGYYGAWRIEDICSAAGDFPGMHLEGLWYFQDDGTGNFAIHSPIPGTLWLLGLGLLGLAVLKRRLRG